MPRRRSRKRRKRGGQACSMQAEGWTKDGKEGCPKAPPFHGFTIKKGEEKLFSSCRNGQGYAEHVIRNKFPGLKICREE